MIDQLLPIIEYYTYIICTWLYIYIYYMYMAIQTILTIYAIILFHFILYITSFATYCKEKLKTLFATLFKINK